MRRERLSIVAVEPWLGGSHERFLDTWRARSAHAVEVLGLPARHWKWRMQGAAHTLAQMVGREGIGRPDAVLASAFLDLPRFRGFLPPAWAGVPAVLYFHENQLTFPGRPGDEPRERDGTYGFANVLSCLAAQRVVFNSAFHRDEFAAAARELVQHLPRPRPAQELDQVLAAARVVGPGVELETLARGPGPGSGRPLRVAFNHRWEHDKDPAAFLRAVRDARGRGADLELVLLGEHFQEQPPDVATLAVELDDVTLHRGFARDRAEYARLLGECDLVVSTARHEFFGISLLEAMATGCTPLAPRRLAYPEVLPAEQHAFSLYDREGELTERLVAAAADPAPLRATARREANRGAVERHDVRHVARQLDELFAELSGAG